MNQRVKNVRKNQQKEAEDGKKKERKIERGKVKEWLQTSKRPEGRTQMRIVAILP